MKQTISNACGTIGALHAIANNQAKSAMGKSLATMIQDEWHTQGSQSFSQSSVFAAWQPLCPSATASLLLVTCPYGC